MHIAIVSSMDYCGKISEDICLVKVLNEKNILADIVSWDDYSVDWEKYDLAVLRSAWDYHTKYDLFIKWLDMLDSKNIVLINNTKIVRWNIRKDLQLSMLKDLGLPIIPYIISKSIGTDFNDIFQKLDAKALVIKPIISASGNNTFLINLSDIKQSTKKDIKVKFKDQSFIIQPFIENIKNGEYALIFIDGKFSHAAIRFPGILAEKKSSVYINKEDIPKSILTLAKQCSKCIKNYFGQFPTYARYDIVDGYIIEVELAEPDLMTRTILSDDNKQDIINKLAIAIIKRSNK